MLATELLLAQLELGPGLLLVLLAEMLPAQVAVMVHDRRRPLLGLGERLKVELLIGVAVAGAAHRVLSRRQARLGDVLRLLVVDLVVLVVLVLRLAGVGLRARLGAPVLVVAGRRGRLLAVIHN